MKKILLLVCTIFILSCSSNQPALVLPALICDHMVLQQNKLVALWGKCKPGVTVTADASWGAKANAETDEQGNWKLEINTPPAGGPYTITFSAKKTSITVSDVLIGEVWICSGQSNMEMPVKGFQFDSINFSKNEIANADYPQIRLFSVARKLSYVPLTECSGKWEVCSPLTNGEFSATAYFFGRELFNKLNVPIGLIQSSWGGTPAESWTSPEYLKNVMGYESIVDDMASAEDNIIKLKNWLSMLDSIDLTQLPEDNSFSAIKLDDANYSLAEFTDTSWSTMTLPGLWETNGLPSFDGVVWYRKEFELPKNIYPEGFELHLGPIDDMDAAYVNGIKIGNIEKEGFWTENRSYSIPQSALKEGKNVVAVRVIDTRGGGGIYGNQISIVKGEKIIVNLNGEWKYKPVGVIFNNILYKYSDGDHSFASMPKLGFPFESGTPTLLYNGMIAPLVSYTIKGAIWYQGESNVGRGKQYRQLFPAMIQNWRDAWQQGDFPFYFVQIAPYNYNNPFGTAELREAQLLTLNQKNVGMVVTMDIGNPANIHPGNKQDVGKRLALWALAKDYAVEGIDFSGPIFKSVSFDKNKALVEFDYADSLVCKGGKLLSFEIAGADSVYYPAEASIDNNKVIVTSKKVKTPLAVRYAWDDDVEPNLFDESGLPASPFRTVE